ncbi:Bacterial regulatory protein, gntR family [Planctomycetes bacterium CA13]|uniref:Bacterial regulatory protein, gntR family n=1 Tax=Novipirellula herctigrandis TaxID=2527986 RepID=A0A5C5ZBE4_9BACT|nr:Bacterial regulatory protein, gntR family [Planctomycetes bacterium CA13]
MGQNLSELSYEYIRAKLASGEVPAEQPLVRRTLAEEIGVSVIPVREAINRLSSEGLVDHVAGAGAVKFITNSIEAGGGVMVSRNGSGGTLQPGSMSPYRLWGHWEPRATKRQLASNSRLPSANRDLRDRGESRRLLL